MKMTLYRAVFTDSPNNGEWVFKPIPFRDLAFVIYLLFSEHDEEEQDRELRVMALLNGEVVCTNVSAYKLVRE